MFATIDEFKRINEANILLLFVSLSYLLSKQFCGIIFI